MSRRVLTSPSSRAPQVDENLQMRALTSSMHGVQNLLLLSDLMFATAFLAIVVLHPFTPALGRGDAIIVGLLMALFLAGQMVLRIRSHRLVYWHFRLTTGLAALVLLILLAHALLRGAGPDLTDGVYPWVLSYSLLLVAYLCAFQIRRHAQQILIIFATVGCTLFVIAGYTLREEFSRLFPALFWSTGVLTMLLGYAYLLAQLQFSVQGTALAEAETRRRTLEQALISAHREEQRDPQTGGLSEAGLRQAFDRARTSHRTFAVLLLRIRDFNQVRRDEGHHWSVRMKQIGASLEALQDSPLPWGRLREDLFAVLLGPCSDAAVTLKMQMLRDNLPPLQACSEPASCYVLRPAWVDDGVANLEDLDALAA